MNNIDSLTLKYFYDENKDFIDGAIVQKIQLPSRYEVIFNLRNLSYNVLILDERGEIAGEANELSVGKFADVLSFSDKKTGFIQGIRSMSPHIIVTDEIGDYDDFLAIKYAGYCGVKVMATIHANNIEDLKSKDGWQDVKNVFERYVVLSKRNGPGTIEGVYNEDFSRLAIWR